MQRAGELRHPLPEHVAAADVGELVGEDRAATIGVPIIGLGREDEDRPNGPPRHRNVQTVTLEKPYRRAKVEIVNEAPDENPIVDLDLEFGGLPSLDL